MALVCADADGNGAVKKFNASKPSPADKNSRGSDLIRFMN